MNIQVNSASISTDILKINNAKKLLIAGPAISNYKAREIVLPASDKEALNLFGKSDLYDAYVLLKSLGVENIYISNCYSESDYIRLSDKIIHYDFDYFIPIGIYFGDTFYNPIIDRQQYYAEYFLEQFKSVDCLTTIIMTERHASLYKDFDHYVISMANIETKFTSSFNHEESAFLDEIGNNLIFIYNNLKEIPFANVVLGALFVNRDYAKYLSSLKTTPVIYDIDYNDMANLRAMYFKYNYFTGETTVENPMNFRSTLDIYANALIDDVIKRVIKTINLDEYKGQLYNQYVAIQIESQVNKALNSMKGKLFKEYTINRIGFKKTESTAGYIIADYSFIPFGTFESANVIMGV